MKRMITGLIDWFLYTVLTEKRRQQIAGLFSERQKEFIKRFTQDGKRHQQKLHIKQIRDNLYSLGQRQAALKDLIQIVEGTKDSYFRRLAAFELALWHTNDLSEEAAEKALPYIELALEEERDTDQVRRLHILKAEVLQRLGQVDKAQETLDEIMQDRQHPDLYLAKANLCDDIEEKLGWINRSYAHFNNQAISFSSLTEAVYDGLQMAAEDPKVHVGPKVSILMPCYNAAEGVKTAIESLLNQTWQNIELILVDDHSPDDTYEVIQAYAEKDERIKVLQTPKNSGPYIARNIALKAATGEFITVNDSDDWSHEKKIETQVRHLLANEGVIANTSSHARLTEDLHIYRRGTPGRYLFPNMSSIMFRREAVMEKLGYWDEVRFAADGEFKRRLLRAFGEESFVDLETAPLSLPRQTVSSLTGSSAFGYNGFFMGVRKEYVESLEHYHEGTEDYYYPHPQEKRLFPVPRPMWPNRDEEGQDKFQEIIAADFRQSNPALEAYIKNRDGKVGLVQLYQYDLSLPISLSPDIRGLIDGDPVQSLVYGEKVTSDKITVIDYDLLLAEQPYIPQLAASVVRLVLLDVPGTSFAKMEEQVKICLPEVERIDWLPYDQEIRQKIEASGLEDDQKYLSEENWVKANE